MLDRLRRASARDCTFSRSAAASGIVVVVRCMRFAPRVSEATSFSDQDL